MSVKEVTAHVLCDGCTNVAQSRGYEFHDGLKAGYAQEMPKGWVVSGNDRFCSVDCFAATVSE